MKTALITGVSGQDGAYLAELLLHRGYTVHGTSRDAETTSLSRLDRLGIKNRIHMHSMALTDFRSVIQVVATVNPDEIYNLAGQSSVGLSFEQPVETLESISLGTLNLLEVIRFLNRPIRLYNASSSECFGDTGGTAAHERTPFRPRSPYAVAKAAAFWQVANYREAYGLYACSGILFNHESPLRPRRFVTQKIVSSACRIAGGAEEKLHLGNTAIRRDWGWAPEYTEAMWRMLQIDTPNDFVIATGIHSSLEDFIEAVFTTLHLDWRDHVVIDRQFYRPTDIAISVGDPTKAAQLLAWVAAHPMPSVARLMVEAELGSVN
jgi:GDPmannose 4,6-dehydratase